jgi:inhibitor of cysteine peptidase
MRLSVFGSLALVALAVAPLVACSQESGEDDNIVTPGGEEESTEDELRSLSLTEADDGKTVTVTEGQNLVVKLQSNPTTGYKWAVASTDRTFGYPATDTYSGPGASGPVGAGGLQKLTWKTNSPLNRVGSHTVKLEYKRSWETGAPAKVFTFTVKIVDALPQ